MAEEASPARFPRDHLDDRFDQRAGTRSRTASIHPIPAFGRMGDQPARTRPSLRRRILRSFMRFAIAVLIGVGSTLAWQSYGGVAKEMAATRAPTLGWLLSYLPTKSPVVAAPANPAQQLSASGLDALRRSVELLAAKQDLMAQNVAALHAVEEDIRQKMAFTPPSVPVALSEPPSASPQQKPAARTPSPAAASSSAPRRSLPAAPVPVSR